MKKILVLSIIIGFQAFALNAQSLSEALELYRAEQFSEALAIFEQLDDDQAFLFAGKSHLALSSYHDAIRYFRKAENSDRSAIRHEALYSNAIAQFRLKNYDRSLDYLYRILSSEERSGVRFDAQRFYRQILSYLSVGERFETLQRSDRASVRYDLVNQSKTFVDEGTYYGLVSQLLRMEPDSTLRAELKESLRVETEIRQFFDRYPAAPQGMVYHIGVVLPEFAEDDPDFLIPRNLYQGMMLAADDFNSRNPDKKVRLFFKNSAENPDTAAAALTELKWGRNADAIIGPLFSEPARRMAQLAEEYRIPMLAPLANSDEINLDYNYTFQLNPTFEVHGRNMARFAVRELGLDTLAVITESGSLGSAAASSFRREAERLGAFISYYIDEDFASFGYDISGFTEVFTPDSVLIDSLNYIPSQAIYAPFTGQAAPTLTNLLLNDLEAMRSQAVILGSEEWANANLSAFQRRLFEIYYTEAFGSTADTSAVEFFREDFETRFGSEADRFAKIGYDAATYLFRALETAGNPVYLGKALREESVMNGMALRVEFDGNRINQHVFINGLTPRAIERLEARRIGGERQAQRSNR
jgi:ABC-type branched-subunit amino acid transport system substrate-binding protein